MNYNQLNILVFAYLRPTHLKDCLDALIKNPLAQKATLTICIDGIKSNASAQSIQLHQETIEVAQKEDRFLSNSVIVNEVNYGVGKQYFEKIQVLLQKYEHLVIVEDDVVVGSYFLNYISDAFSLFGNQDNIAMIVGYMYYIPFFKKENSCFFNKGGGNQAFGITRKFWDNIDTSCQGYEQLKWDKNFRRSFNSDGHDHAKLLIDEIENNRNDAWDAIVYWNIFKKNLVCLYPDFTLATNNGWGSVGATHTFIDNPFESRTFDSEYAILNFPESIAVDQKKRTQIIIYLKYFIRFKFYYIRLKSAVRRFRKKLK